MVQQVLMFLSADQHDEIDIELLGGDASHWQTNVFTTNPHDKEPLWGVFGEIEDYPKKKTIDQYHRYTIDWNEDRIVWSVNDVEVRTLRKGVSDRRFPLSFRVYLSPISRR